MKKYQIIYADPPWKFKTYSKPQDGLYFKLGASIWRNADVHYKTMTLEDICNIPVWSITSDDCILFLWVTAPMIKDAFTVVNKWGFTYKTKAFCWVKQNKLGAGLFTGMGYWTRSNTEDCWLCTRGNPKRISASVGQVILSPVQGHSQKPDIVRERIVQLMGDLPRIELFARRKVEGWDCWGNEVESDIEL